MPPGTAATWSGTLSVPAAGKYWLNIQALGGTGQLVVDGKTLTTVGGGFTSAPRYGVVHPTDGNAPTATTDGLANGRTLVALAAGAHTLVGRRDAGRVRSPGPDPAELGDPGSAAG